METPISTPAAVEAPPAVSAPETPVSAPAPNSSDFDSAFDAAFGDGSPAATPDAAPSASPEVVTADADPTADQSAQPGATPEDEQLAAQGEQQTPEEVDPYEEIKPDSVSADGKRFFFREAKAKAMLASHQTLQQLRDIDPAITVDGIKGMYARTLEMDRFLGDFDSGDPRRVAGVAAMFVNKNSNPQSVAAFVDSTIAAAEQIHPDLATMIRNRAFLAAANDLLKTGKEEDRLLAWNLEHRVRGETGDYARYRNPQQPAADPLAQVRQAQAQLTQQQRAFNQQRMQEHQARVQQAVSAAQADANAAVDKIIDDALAVIPANVREQRAFEFKASRRDLREKFDEIAGKTDIYKAQYNNLLSQMRANPSEQARNALVQFVEQRAAYAIGKMKKEVLQRFNDSVMSQSAALHQKQQALQTRREPGSGNIPVQRGTSLAAKLRHVSNPTNDQMIDAAFG